MMVRIKGVLPAENIALKAPTEGTRHERGATHPTKIVARRYGR